jgi:hypothetical protein
MHFSAFLCAKSFEREMRGGSSPFETGIKEVNSKGTRYCKSILAGTNFAGTS